MWLSLFPTLIWWNECVIWQTRFTGQCYAQQDTKGCRILLLLDSTTSKLAPSLILCRTGLHFLVTCYSGYRGRIEFPSPLLTLLQLQSYRVLYISARIFIIPKLQNIHCGQFYAIFRELFSFYIERLPNCYSVRLSNRYIDPDWAFRGHISRALPTRMIFYLLRSIPTKLLIRVRGYNEELRFDTLEIIVKWLQVSVIECNWQTPQTKNLICV